ncbi:MAG TPA: group III truncated hemoglobin [Mucilaginibacter sp.]|nr:group III truncated hemoglobin [Mucilaginibacter sp.]
MTRLSDKNVNIVSMEITKKPIENREDIRLLVENFYSKVKNDDMIGDIFNDVLVFRWDTHIPIMIDFWDTVLLDGSSYRGNTMRVHIELNKVHPLKPEHFARWKKLFFETLDEHFAGDKANEAKSRVELMEVLIQTKIARSDDPNFIQ